MRSNAVVLAAALIVAPPLAARGADLERAGFTLADIPKERGAFWSFWCDQVQPAVRRALGREDIWGVGLPMSAAGGDTIDELFQFQLAYKAP